MTEPISVTALNQYIKGLLDRDRLLSQVLVRSEISNYKVYPSGAVKLHGVFPSSRG